MVKDIFSFSLVCLLVWGLTAFADTESQENNLSETINYLLSFVENSDCIFIRNDKEHTAGDAVVHIRRKYEHFKNKIRTPEDFIRLTATKSLLTDKPYSVKLKDGRIISSEVWLLEALEAYRVKRK
jgi:hypothetical protein